MKISSLAAAIVLGLSGTAAFAQATDSGWYIAPTVGVTLNDSVRGANTGAGVGLAVGKVLNEKWNVEFGVQRLRFVSSDIGNDDDQGSIGVDALYFFNRNPDFAPYAVAGLAYALEARPYGPYARNDNLLIKAGLGFTKKLSQNIDFRTDVRYQWHNNKTGVIGYKSASDVGDWVVSAGLNIYFDGRTQAPAPYVAPAYVAPVYVAPEPVAVTPAPAAMPVQPAPAPYMAPIRATKPDRN
ncbi:hypothetical protein RCH06_000176 [Polaromonas sp. CG_9.5]|uniref:outer membrane beta-barrel protein n=1 Tax=Polaromonas sp. CG_9.5 TaxID=3071705 RepID=UPI002DF95F80|nr:hypothetical protein [Polaromonas sp. CG_9.5]